MKNLRKAIALLLAVALLAEPCIAAGSVKEVKAAETTTKVYEQMKVTDVSLRVADGQDKDAITIGNEGIKLTTDVAVNVPDGWVVSEVAVAWQEVNAEEDFDYEYVSKKFDSASQPEDHVYSVDYNLHKYAREDMYHLMELYVEFVEVGNEKNYYAIYGEPADYGKVASAANPIEFEWWVETEDDIFDGETSNYYGTADFTILKAAGKDTKAPKVTSLKINNIGVIQSGVATEISVTANEDTSGIYQILISTETDEWDEEYMLFEASADDLEKYKGKQTFTLKSESESLKYRGSGKYRVYEVYICDYAGNYTEYYLNDAGTYLVSEEYVKNEDGSYDEITQKIKTVKYSVCNGHVYKNSVTKATTSANGSMSKICKYCDTVKAGSKTTISRIKNVKLSKTSYVYDGKVKKPTVSVFDAKGKKIAATNYTVTYPSGRKNAGEYKVKIVFKNNYKGTVYKTFTINPKGTSIASTSRGTKKFTVKWKKQATQTTGYQVRYSTSSSFKTYNSKLISNKNTTSATIKNLKAGKKYYVKVRTYKIVKVNGQNKKIYSAWSGVKAVTTK